MIGGFGEPRTGQCSRAGCVELAAWRIEWSNPRIHRDGRTKTWLACAEHREFLQGFLESRSFPVSVQPFGESDDAEGRAS